MMSANRLPVPGGNVSDDNAAVIGRFAPSPTGPLHFGSLVAALGSWLSARSRGGRWLLRIDDIDPERAVPGAADAIQRALEACGLTWDGPVVYQSQRLERYAEALSALRQAGHLYPCSCSRRSLAGRTRRGPLGLIYPGTCRHRAVPEGGESAWRFRVPSDPPAFTDQLQPSPPLDLPGRVGDVIVSRRNGWPAYHLATAVDDACPAITEVVRGGDLLWTTPVQIALMQALGLTPPSYRHLPLALGNDGQKLSKQTHAPALRAADARRTLHRALCFLRQHPPPDAADAPVSEQLDWARHHWRPEPLRGVAGSKVAG